MGHVSLVYIHDEICGTKDELSSKAASAIQRKDLSLSGLKVNEEKTDWQPKQIGQWSGFIIDTIRMIFQVPPKKLEKLKSAITDVLNPPKVCLRSIARIAGYLNSMTFALGPIARLFTRQMYHLIACRESWRDIVILT